MTAFERLVDQLAALDFAHGPVLAKSLHASDAATAEAALIRWGRTPKTVIRKALAAHRAFQATGLRLPTRADFEAIAADGRARQATMGQLSKSMRAIARTLPKPHRRTSSAPSKAKLARLFTQARNEVMTELSAGRVSPDEAHRMDLMLRQGASARGIAC